MENGKPKQTNYLNSKIKIRRWILVFVVCHLTFAASCSVPNLETPQCAAARLAVKEFYSVHFGNEMQPSDAYFERRKNFLTADLSHSVSKSLTDRRDYFTGTEDYPKAFRVGGCEEPAPDRTVFQIVFFWKDDVRTEQRELKAEAIKINEKWLINRVYER